LIVNTCILTHDCEGEASNSVFGSVFIIVILSDDGQNETAETFCSTQLKFDVFLTVHHELTIY